MPVGLTYEKLIAFLRMVLSNSIAPLTFDEWFC